MIKKDKSEGLAASVMELKPLIMFSFLEASFHKEDVSACLSEENKKM